MAAATDNVVSNTNAASQPPLRWRVALVWTLTAAASFHVAQLVPYAGIAILGFFLGLINLTHLNNARHGFRWGIALGWLIYVPHLAFFWNVFVPAEGATISKMIGGVGVFALWMVLPIWLGLFLSLATWLRRWTRPKLWFWLIPCAWMGIEYFRSELYPLKFSWLSAGYMFAETPWMLPLNTLGMFGSGFALLLIVTIAAAIWKRSRWIAAFTGVIGVVLLIGLGMTSMGNDMKSNGTMLPIGGVQLEFPSNHQIVQELDRLIEKHPETRLCVLSEYTFNGPVPDEVRNWCRENQRYLIAGGKDPLGTTNFYNTAFVVDPDGEIVFKQVKSVPIQFFADGLPAPTQRVWDSPWGKLGLCICYDMSYTRVTDELVRQGAEAIIVPTMDVKEWGAYQHWLHAHVTPVRAAEYGIPIFRLTSSGISQHVLASGEVAASRPCPGQGEELTANLILAGKGARPLDRWFAPMCVVITGATALFAAIASTRRWIKTSKKRPQP